MRNTTIGISLLLGTSLASAAPQIPLCPGLTIVTAIAESQGDYESIKKVESMDARELQLKYSAEVPDRGLFAEEGAMKKVTEIRTLRNEDLRSSRHYLPVFAEDSDGFFPGTTSIGTSTAVLRGLKTTGSESLGVTIQSGMMDSISASRDEPGNVYDAMVKGKIERIAQLKVPVLVNDRRVELDAIQARAQLEGASKPSEFVFLDDEQNPLTLRFRIVSPPVSLPMLPEFAEMCAAAKQAGMQDMLGTCDTTGGAAADSESRFTNLDVIKISYQCGAPANAGNSPSLEQSLEKSGRADIYSIYFSFNSDEIREESEPTLKEIASLMRKHADWKLSIHGHTDNIASDKYNLELSQRRAAAVTKALTTKYGVDGTHLSYSGHGESSPKDRNDTLEGRARNRRVELVRLP